MLDEFSAGLEIRQGTLRDAILYSTGANATHGLQRSAEDKRRVVTRLLDDAEWSQWSDREIARRCHVDHRFVGRLREKLTGDIPSERTYTTKHGTIAIMDTSAIGKPAAKTAARDAPRTEWSLPENTGSGGAVAELRGPAPPDAGAILTPEPVGELRVDLSLPGAQVTHAPSSDGFCTYKMLKHYLDIRRPPLPSQSGVQAMTPEQLATIRRLAEQQRAWIAGLQEKIEAGSGQ